MGTRTSTILFSLLSFVFEIFYAKELRKKELQDVAIIKLLPSLEKESLGFQSNNVLY